MNQQKMTETGQWWMDSWNPVVGCTPYSDLCKNCYAKGLHDIRHKAYLEGKKLPKQYAKPFEEIQLLPERLDKPLHWREPRIIFVNSMSDLFHKDVPFEFIDKVIATIALCPRHTFLICTKRIERMVEYINYKFFSEAGNDDICEAIEEIDENADPNNWQPDNMPNLWFGCTPTKPEDIETLLSIPAAHRFISLEPMLEKWDISQYLWVDRNADNNLDEYGQLLDWVIVGAETGANARYCPIENIESVVEQCKAAGVPVWVKSVHLGGEETFIQAHKFAELPESVRIRQLPFTGKEQL